MPLLADDRALATAIAHHVRASHRLRLEVSTLLGNDSLARAIERSASARPGVRRVEANPRSGRVLIEYAPGAAVIDELLGAADGRRGSLDARPRRSPSSAPPQLGNGWHARTVADVAAQLATDAATGIPHGEARKRLAAHGDNTIADEAPPSRLALLVSQVANLPTGLLVGSMVVSLLLGDIIEAGAIVLVVGLNAAIGYRVERRSEDLLAAWRVAEIGDAQVIRGGRLATVAASQLVPGDVIVVREGAVISADARVIDAQRLAADEAALTGESEPVDKSDDPVGVDAPLATRRSMLYRGTSIASGHGRAIVVATGGGTEIAAVQRLAAESRAPRARLRGRLDALASRLAWSGLAAAGVASLASLAWRKSPLEILRHSVALGVAAIPEGLPVTATAALVRAMSRMRAKGVVVRRLSTAETLGGITALCTDKTGTLTENRMRLDRIVLADGTHVDSIPHGATGSTTGPLAGILVASVLNSDVDYEGGAVIAGSSTESALVDAARRAGLDPCALRARWPRRRLEERCEGKSYVISEHDGELAFVKGAPEQVVELCDVDPAPILAHNAALAGDGLRVLAVGYRNGDSRWHLLGLVGLRDPLREGSAHAVRAAAAAGIRTIMLTGDQRATAAAIARGAQLDGEVVEGSDLPAVLADPARLARVAVIARVAPADKLAVVEALRRQGDIVAMAGDGINDAPALRAADVGIAVGARSSDLARQTADIVLEQADLRAILAAIAEGRAVQDNLRRSIRFQAAGNLGEILLVVGGALTGRMLIPSLGLLWINLLTDTLPGLALALEPSDAGLLDRPPARPGAPILDRADWTRVVRDGALIAVASGVAAVIAGPSGAFASIGATQFGYAAACRAPDAPLRGRFVAMLGGSAALHLLAVASAPARRLLGFTGRSPAALACAAIGMAAPLYLAWRKHATRSIVRTKETR